MKTLLKYYRKIDKIWRAIWFFIFFGFLSLDALFPGFFGITLLKLLGIALCVVFVLQKYNEDKLLLIAFILTFLADLLLAFNNSSLFGVFVFIMAQYTHFVRLKPLRLSIRITIAIILTAIFVISAAFGIYTMFILGAVYAFFLFSNIYLTYRWQKTAKGSAKKPATFAFYGFLLFLCCDLCAASSFLVTIHALPFVIKRLIDFACWAFYYPSQVLISNSGKKLESSEKL